MTGTTQDPGRDGPALTARMDYAEARAAFSRERLWALFDGNHDRLNIAHECVDRHRAAGLAVRIARADGGVESMSYAALADASSQIAHWLVHQGIGVGERVAIMLEPSPAFYAALFGVLKRGAVAVPLFTLFGPEGLRARTQDCRPSLLVVTESKRDMAMAALAEQGQHAPGRGAGPHRAVDAGPRVLTGMELLEAASAQPTGYRVTTAADDLALLQYTSGTTRELPEAVPHRHRAVVTVAVAALYATGVRAGDRFMCPSSPAWGHGLAHGTLGPLGLGASVASYAGPFDPLRLLEALERLEINNLSAAATHYRMLRACGEAGRFNLQLDKLSFTGEPLDASTAAWAEDTFGAPVCSVYGTTEVGVVLAQYPGMGLPVKRGALGRPLPGLEVQVLRPDGTPAAVDEVGELAVRRRTGWVYTKDHGHIDADGDFFHDGRADDVIISAGWTIAAREVEEALLAHPTVVEAAAIGVPDALRGQVVKAFVILRAPADAGIGPAAADAAAATVSALQQFVKAQLSAHAYPRRIELVSSLPKTPAGKVNRRALRALEGAREASSVNQQQEHT